MEQAEDLAQLNKLRSALESVDHKRKKVVACILIPSYVIEIFWVVELLLFQEHFSTYRWQLLSMPN